MDIYGVVVRIAYKNGRLGFDENVEFVHTLTQISSRKFLSVSCGLDYTIAIDEKGRLWGYGNNEFGQLGINGMVEESVFELTKVSEKKFVGVSCGSCCTLAIDKKEHLWGCGDNSAGQLGLGYSDMDDVYFFDFQKVSEQKFESVSFAGSHTIALDDDNFIWSCGGIGYDDDVNDQENKSIFTKVNNMPKIDALMNFNQSKRPFKTKVSHKTYQLHRKTK